MRRKDLLIGVIALSARRRFHFQFCHAIMEYALQEKLTQLGGIQRTYWLTMWERMGWAVRIAGELVQFDDGPWFPAYFDVPAGALAGAARWNRPVR